MDQQSNHEQSFLDAENLRVLALNGGSVQRRPNWLFRLPPVSQGYADAQVDDYGLQPQGRRHYPWKPGMRLRLRARFSHDSGQLLGTAGFGFWNAPFSDPTVKWPALPQATWFFYASDETNLPLAAAVPGRGWFASTIDAATWGAKGLIPLAPLVLLLNQVGSLRRRLWPLVQQRLGMSFASITTDMRLWHHYELVWQNGGCEFRVDNEMVLRTTASPRGPLGFVCWLDNQYLVATANGRWRWGVLPVLQEQWMEVADLRLERLTAIRAG